VFQPYASVATNLLFFTKGKSTQKIWYFEHKLPEGYKAYSKTKPIQLSEFDELKKQVFCFVTHLKVKNKHLGKKIHMFSLTEY
jgi:type I restriction-modification system DNA methylase subunit